MSSDANLKPPCSESALIVRAVSLETFVCLAILGILFGVLASQMGIKNMLGTIIATAFDILTQTVFFIMAVAVIAGALASLMAEFGVVALINRILSPLMRPLYHLPGAAALAMLATFMSDNPAIIALGKERNFIKYFTYRQRALFTNLGTTFGMGLIVSTFMLSIAKDSSYVIAVFVGVFSAFLASIVSVRLMDFFAKRHYGPKGEELVKIEGSNDNYDIMQFRKIREGSFGYRALNALLDGGKNGVELGFSIAPGVLVICTFVMMLVFGPSEATGSYTGASFEGVPVIPLLAQKIDFILTPLFGFSSPEAVAFPCTALGAVGGALGLVPSLLEKGLIGANDIAVFTAMGMCWSGYLSTHVSMMDVLHIRELTGKAIFSHTIAGLSAGIMSNWILKFVFLLEAAIG